MKRQALLFAAAIAVTGIAADAHHPISVYDSSRQVTLDGIVAQFQLVNPHPFLLIDVKDGTAAARPWKAETDNRSELVAIGVTVGSSPRIRRQSLRSDLRCSSPPSLRA